ncbi:MAG TPA: hypothetical protein DCX32_04500 [Candidatus Moranbacteria bacterium]|nr:MAG: hypothetical protein UW87_C0002G0037 [Candidatus Moranbacteria bacterium GW2011_GWC2_45_10]KKT95207.1 MAG: hypothetical protein UW95_C0003G0049 [Parcubacteria group bacterium GW2011_GWC1_45_14]HAV11768.1 hypothetical protein [Candidatus Moranbacteria bacterium]
MIGQFMDILVFIILASVTLTFFLSMEDSKKKCAIVKETIIDCLLIPWRIVSNLESCLVSWKHHPDIISMFQAWDMD